MRLHKLQKKAEESYTPKATTVRCMANLAPLNLRLHPSLARDVTWEILWHLNWIRKTIKVPPFLSHHAKNRRDRSEAKMLCHCMQTKFS